MHHYERSREFAKAEDALFAMLEAEPGNAGLVEFGVAFYERLRSQNDAALEASNLPPSWSPSTTPEVSIMSTLVRVSDA